MNTPFITFDQGEALLDWVSFTQALEEGHKLPKAEIGDTFLYRGKDTLLSRAAWIDGLGIAVKSATVFPDNPDQGKPVVNGGVSLYADGDGTLDAIVDFHLVTKWKTAGDSLLGAMKLARADSRNILIVGAGTVGRSLCEAFGAGFPNAKQVLWNRTTSKAEELARNLDGVDVAEDLPSAVETADIIVTATMATSPVIRGEWLRPGQHLNLIGAYRPDMRETDHAALQRARIYADSFDTTLDHIGEFKIPLAEGALKREQVLADFYSIDRFERGTDKDITLFKNGGGAHLDLMTSRHILDRWIASQA